MFCSCRRRWWTEWWLTWPVDCWTLYRNGQRPGWCAGHWKNEKGTRKRLDSAHEPVRWMNQMKHLIKCSFQSWDWWSPWEGETFSTIPFRRCSEILNLCFSRFLKERSTCGASSWQHTGTKGRWSVTQEFLAYAIIRRNGQEKGREIDLQSFFLAFPSDDRISEKLLSNRPSSLRPCVLSFSS